MAGRSKAKGEGNTEILIKPKRREIHKSKEQFINLFHPIRMGVKFPDSTLEIPYISVGKYIQPLFTSLLIQIKLH